MRPSLLFLGIRKELLQIGIPYRHLLINSVVKKVPKKHIVLHYDNTPHPAKLS